MSCKHIVHSGEAAAQALSVDALQLYPVCLQLLAVPAAAAAAAAALIKPGCGGNSVDALKLYPVCFQLLAVPAAAAAAAAAHQPQCTQ
jgi:hypothetical protein